jgi:hypothetical protein
VLWLETAALLAHLAAARKLDFGPTGKMAGDWETSSKMLEKL